MTKADAIGSPLSGCFEPAEHRAQAFAHLFDLVAAVALTELVHLRLAGVAFGYEVLGESAVLDVTQDALHLSLGVGGVGDRIAHGREAAFDHQVNDQLDLVQALEIGQLCHPVPSF